MVIFHSYVSLPEGTPKIKVSFDVRGFRSCVVLRKAPVMLCEKSRRELWSGLPLNGWKLLVEALRLCGCHGDGRQTAIIQCQKIQPG